MKVVSVFNRSKFSEVVHRAVVLYCNGFTREMYSEIFTDTVSEREGTSATVSARNFRRGTAPSIIVRLLGDVIQPFINRMPFNFESWTQQLNSGQNLDDDFSVGESCKFPDDSFRSESRNLGKNEWYCTNES